MSKTILIVEDDKSVQKLLSDALEGEGFSVLVEKDGNWALKTFETKDVDFVILDVLIPVMNGFQLADRIRKIPKGENVPILMISGVYRAVSHRNEAIKKYRVIDYLDKPVKLEQIFNILKKTFGNEYPRRISQPKPESRGDTYADSVGISEKYEVDKQEEEMSFEISTKGNLKDTPFPELLAAFYQKRATGILLLKYEKIKKIVYIRDGRPIFVKSNLLNECLGRILVREKMITEEELNESVKRMKDSGRQQGTILIEMGAISPHNLKYGLEKQLEIKLYDIFGWPEGEYQFNQKEDFETPITTLELSVASIIYEGIKRNYDVGKIEQYLEKFQHQYLHPNPNPALRFQEMLMDEDEENILKSIDGTKTLRETMMNAQISRERMLRFIFALKMNGMIVIYPYPAGQEAPPPLPVAPPPIPTKQVEPPRHSQDNILPLEDREIKNKILKRLSIAKNGNYFDLLGVNQMSTISEIKRAYITLAKEFHPDRIPTSAGREVRKMAEELFQILTEAHNTLTDEQKRQEYINRVIQTGKTEAADEVTRLLAAEGKFQAGEEFLKKRLFGKAAESFKEALDLYPDEAEYFAYYGWALYQSEPENQEVLKKARDAIATAITKNPKLDKAYLFMGYIYKGINRDDLAERQFEKAIQCNPDCTDALRELKLLDLKKRELKK
ncbi:MAG: response regulator [Deltaproteobacteria bacterium]|nr:response regulator [Deltaproteobacteria bacterium]